MRWCAIGQDAVGKTLSRAVCGANGEVLMNGGTVLSETYVRGLAKRGVLRIAIDDAATNDIVIEDIISDVTRGVATGAVSKVFETLRATAVNLGNGDVHAAAAKIESDQMERAGMHCGISDIFDAADMIVDEALGIGFSKIGSLTYAKSVDNYPFSHAVDTAVIAVMVGRRIRVKEADLRRLARGCLLRDIGNIFVPDSILLKEEPLTPDELAVVRDHTTLGYRLLRRINPFDFVANHVAFQHHERQDGSGYPRGLRGTNRRTRAEGAFGYLHTLAELAAVADVYDAMVSERPQRAAMTPEQAVFNIRSVLGTHLNKEIADAFLSILPVYPLGVGIKVSDGRLRGCIGIVAKHNFTHQGRPIIRILTNIHGVKVSPMDVDLLQYPDLEIASFEESRELSELSSDSVPVAC